jgi:hypothetical protein
MEGHSEGEDTEELILGLKERRPLLSQCKETSVALTGPRCLWIEC